MRGDGRWFKGVMGAKRHIRLAHKAISTMTTNKVLFGAHEVERLVERNFTLSELDDLRNGRIPAPVARQGTSETLDESFQEKDGLDAYIPYDKYPTIIRRADGEWVELRCPTCNGNCINGNYFVGVDAFRKHLERDHGHVIPLDENPAAWVVQQCEIRKLTEHELLGLFDDREDAEPPEKIPAAVKEYDDEERDLPREESFEDDVVTNPRSQKRHARSTLETFEEDSDDLNEHTPKRVKRETKSDSRQNQTTTLSHLRYVDLLSLLAILRIILPVISQYRSPEALLTNFDLTAGSLPPLSPSAQPRTFVGASTTHLHKKMVIPLHKRIVLLRHGKMDYPWLRPLTRPSAAAIE